MHECSFVLMNMYEGARPLYHFDLYRLEDPQAIRSIEYDEFLQGRGISVIEWADRLGKLMPKNYIKVELKHQAEGRLIKVSLKGKRV